MTDLNTCTGLLVGREPSSKSHPGTQAASTDVTQGPGCPSYSGGGKDPPSFKTTTPLSPLDLTSLAAAIPGHAPVSASAWTLVEPKKRKEKTNKQTDRHTSKRQGKKQTDRQTHDNNKDKQTDKIGKRGGKLEDSDPPTVSTGASAEGSKGRSVGNHPPADTATPGCLTDEHGDGGRPGTGRDPHASGVSSTNTIKAGQTAARDRANDGGHNDPKVDPIPAQGATGLGGTNIARPPTTKTTTTTTTNTQPIVNTTKGPNLPSSRPHPRRRNRNRGGVKTQTSPQGTGASSSGLPNKKRDRLDDTISPRGEHKRARTDQRQTRVATDTSYARAAQSHLCVAITTAPRFDLTQAEADTIQGQIQKAIFAACIEPLAPGQTRYAPAFEGKAFLGDGVLKMWCHDDRALSWLKDKITSLTSPRSGTALTVINQSDIPVKVRAGLFVPDYDGEIGLLHQVLSHQNPWYAVSQWTLFSYQKTNSNPSGMFLILGIPKGELPTILARGRKVAYSTGSIYVRFFTTGGLSDVPPGFDSDPVVRGGPGTEERMEMDELNDQCAEIPEPSVSTVLNNIEEMLSETRADPNTLATDTAPAEQTTARRAHQ